VVVIFHHFHQVQWVPPVLVHLRVHLPSNVLLLDSKAVRPFFFFFFNVFVWQALIQTFILVPPFPPGAPPFPPNGTNPGVPPGGPPFPPPNFGGSNAPPPPHLGGPPLPTGNPGPPANGAPPAGGPPVPPGPGGMHPDRLRMMSGR
jgi:hypothetical protein